MLPSVYTQFVKYLQIELAVSKASIEEALQHIGQDVHLLPIALWQCGMLTLPQLDKSYDWLAVAHKGQDLSAIPEIS